MPKPFTSDQLARAVATAAGRLQSAPGNGDSDEYEVLLTDAERQFLTRTAVRVLQKGEHRLADVAALVLRAARSARAATVERSSPT